MFHHSSTPTLAPMGFPGPFDADSAAGRGAGLSKALPGLEVGRPPPSGLLPSHPPPPAPGLPWAVHGRGAANDRRNQRPKSYVLESPHPAPPTWLAGTPSTRGPCQSHLQSNLGSLAAAGSKDPGLLFALPGGLLCALEPSRTNWTLGFRDEERLREVIRPGQGHTTDRQPGWDSDALT